MFHIRNGCLDIFDVNSQYQGNKWRKCWKSEQINDKHERDKEKTNGKRTSKWRKCKNIVKMDEKLFY